MRISSKYYVLCIMHKSFRLKGLLKLLTFVLLTTYYILHTTSAHAAGPCPTDPAGGVRLGDCFGFGDIKSLGQGTSLLVAPAFSVATTLVVILFLIGAFKYMMSAGDKEQLAAARNMIAQALIGFIILMFIFFILPFLLYSLFKITTFRIF